MLQGSYDYGLVGVSIVLGMLAAYTALDFAGRVTAAHSWARAFWLSGGAIAMGLGIWAMHYVAMLAFVLPVPVFYHYPTVLVSLLAAIGASAVALFTVSRERMGRGAEVTGGVVMGGGVAAMHYIGMAAMRLPAMMQYDWGRVGLSVAVAVGASLAAVILAFRVRQEERTGAKKLVSAAVMGSSIPLMHYTGMWAVKFHACADGFSTVHVLKVSHLGTVVISGTVSLLLALGGTARFLGRLIAKQKAAADAARHAEEYFRTLAEAIPQMVWTARPDGINDYTNARWVELLGLSAEKTAGSGWKQALHPDDLALCLENWEQSLSSGGTLEAEYRLGNAERGYRWYLVRATPMRDARGAIIKWFGTCTDIEEQKHQVQMLEEQIRERTEELADANTRLQEEMWEKDLARKELDRQNERMMDELKERSQRATLLAKMGELLQSCVSKDEVFKAAMGFAPKIFPSVRGAIALLNAERTLAEVIGAWSECHLPSPVFEPNSCWALRTGHPHLVVAGDTTARCGHAAGVENTYLCIPILSQGEALGILHLQTTEALPTLGAGELTLKTNFAEQVGLSIANIRLRDALRTQSVRDPLTGLYNRRYLEEMLEREIRRAVRAEQALGILMLDLDHFKKFNDTYGHDAGDAVLRDTGSFLTKNIRAEDFVCRFGGEEFVVILPTADLEAARARAERIGTKIRDLAVLHKGQSVGKITVSIGVAALPVHGTSAKELLQVADAALYRAKREGRDRVVSAEISTGVGVGGGL